jgi:23S rRNA (cytidine1920-2'-O)/16S rRNA (cytidine1409-2'-O)-methyltransferase
MVMQGLVLVDDQPVLKPGTLICERSKLRLKDTSKVQSITQRFVSRGGDKLQAAIKHFNIDVRDKIAIDVGASTGGFTDCLLENGASLVYAMDVGHSQLADKLRQDKRVVVFEKTHADKVKEIEFDPKPQLAVVDVSFISVRKILEGIVFKLVSPKLLVVLVKPQFELGREFVGKGGVVRSEVDQLNAVELVADFARGLGLDVVGSIPSPIRGAKKNNQEFLMFVKA